MNIYISPDAIVGLKELLDSNWEMIESCLTPLLNALVRLIGDEVWPFCPHATLHVESSWQDASVRKQFTSFFAWLLPKISAVRDHFEIGPSQTFFFVAFTRTTSFRTRLCFCYSLHLLKPIFSLRSESIPFACLIFCLNVFQMRWRQAGVKILRAMEVVS